MVMSLQQRQDLFPEPDPKLEVDAAMAACLFRMEQRLKNLDAHYDAILAAVEALQQQVAKEAKHGQPD